MLLMDQQSYYSAVSLLGNDIVILMSHCHSVFNGSFQSNNSKQPNKHYILDRDAFIYSTSLKSQVLGFPINNFGKTILNICQSLEFFNVKMWS